MRKHFVLSAILMLSALFSFSCFAEGKPNATTLELHSASACLMEASTGEILYEQNADERLEPASVTKVMSLLLFMEALDDGTINLDTPICGSEHASSMGGSQIWLEVGEELCVNDMLKAIVVASANDCTVAMAENLAGSEETFVERMNEKAAKLGMVSTHFSNCTGLPVENHYTTARDIAIMTRELLKHETIFNYTTIWMDTLRGGAMGISNTNKLIRFYNGANGMKTGFTSSALYCLSATAKRGGMQLISTIMKGPTSDERFQDAKKLLDYGFANFSVYNPDVSAISSMTVRGGKKKSVKIGCESSGILLAKGREKLIEQHIELDEFVKAPAEAGSKVGKISYTLDGVEVASSHIVTLEEVKKIGFSDMFSRLLSHSVAIR